MIREEPIVLEYARGPVKPSRRRWWILIALVSLAAIGSQFLWPRPRKKPFNWATWRPGPFTEYKGNSVPYRNDPEKRSRDLFSFYRPTMDCMGHHVSWTPVSMSLIEQQIDGKWFAINHHATASGRTGRIMRSRLAGKLPHLEEALRLDGYPINIEGGDQPRIEVREVVSPDGQRYTVRFLIDGTVVDTYHHGPQAQVCNHLTFASPRFP